jgi:hypothetical protein
MTATCANAAQVRKNAASKKRAKDRETIMNPFNRMSTEPESLKTGGARTLKCEKECGSSLDRCQESGALGAAFLRIGSAKVFAAW